MRFEPKTIGVEGVARHITITVLHGCL